MAVRIQHLINDTLDSASESVSGTIDFKGVTPTKVTLYVQIVETQDNGNPTTTITVEVSPDKGQTLITYDKLLTDAGTDAPASSVAYTATADDIISLSPEDVLDYMKVTAAGSSDMDAGDFHVVDVWVVWTF